MSAVALLGLEWTRPLALVALALPALVWWLARRARGAPLEPTGTLEVWREVAREHPRTTRGRRASLALWFVLASLTLGALALAGPRTIAAREPATWRVVVDRSPSMYLAHDGANGESRLHVALARAMQALERVRENDDVLEWIASDGETARGNEVPATWRAAPNWPMPELAWRAHDAEGTLLVTDRAPAPVHAGFVASGGAAAAGPIALSDEGLIVWNGAELETRAGGAPVRRVRIENGADDESALTPILRVARAWASSRNIDLARDGGCELEIQFASVGAPHPLEAGRDGWLASGRAVSVPPMLASEPWLSARAGGEPIDLVRWRVGLIAIGWRSIDEPRGDPAAFAVSWAKLFDAALAPPPGVVALDERAAAGEPSERAPTRPAASREDDSRPTAAFASLAAVLALTALVLRR